MCFGWPSSSKMSNGATKCIKTEMATSKRELQRGACRCCLSTGALRSMERGSSRRRHTATYSDMLRDTFGLTLARVRGAQLICGVCEIRLRDALAFRTQVLESEQAFLIHTPSQVVEIQISENSADDTCSLKKELEADDNRDNLDDDIPLNTFALRKFEHVECAESRHTEPTEKKELYGDSGGKPTRAKRTRKERAFNYFCVFCMKMIKVKKHFQRHTFVCESINNSALPTKCSLCLTTFAGNAAVISDHMWKEHRCETKYSVYGKTVACDICEKKFPNILKKINHLRRTHHRCRRCSRVFRNMYERDEHVMATHPFPCSLCAKSCATRCARIQHMWDIHGTKCNRCDERFYTKYAMSRHHVKAHGAKMYNCGACGKSYNGKAKLICHQRNFHLLERNFSCPECDYKGFDNQSLKKHMICHSKDKQFQCKYCNKTFARPNNLVFHERIHTGDKRQVCKLCGQAFVQRASLKYHLEKYHPGDV